MKVVSGFSFELPEPRRCFEVRDIIVDNLNISYDPDESIVVLWNRFQIYVYEDLNFDDFSKALAPEFMLKDLKLAKNFLICLDCNGNLYLMSLKSESSLVKRIKTTFFPVASNVTAFTIAEDIVLTLTSEQNIDYICSYKLREAFTLKRKSRLLIRKSVKCRVSESGLKPNKDGIFKSFFIQNEALNSIKYMFPTSVDVSSYHMIIITEDMHNIFAYLYNSTLSCEEMSFVNLYGFPSEICSVELCNVSGVKLVVGLKSGTIIRLHLDEQKKKDEVHLNQAVYKFLTSDNTIIYTDGMEMWKTQNTFSEDLIFKQFCVKQVKDIVKAGDYLICTTYFNRIYYLQLNNKDCYIDPVSSNEYSTAKAVLDKLGVMKNVFNDFNENSYLLNKIITEGNLVATLSLSKRQDIMDKIIEHHVCVYESFEEALKNNSKITLTDNKMAYFEADAIISVQLKNKSRHTFTTILGNMHNNLRFHISLTFKGRILSTKSLNMQDLLKTMTVMLPLKAPSNGVFTQLKVKLRLVTTVPGAYDIHQSIWATLYEKDVILSAEDFIKTKLDYNIICLKESETTDKLINDIARENFSRSFAISSYSKDISTECPFYIRLPDNYKNLFTDAQFYEPLNQEKAKYLLEKHSSEEFLKCNSHVTYEIGNGKVNVQILTNGFSIYNLLKISSDNMMLAYSIRNMFGNLLSNASKKEIMVTGILETIPYSIYVLNESIGESLKKASTSTSSLDEVTSLMLTFQKSVISALPF